MWPRLQMMRQMLKPTGVLAICIDQRELFRLGQLMDELFKERNRLAIINWEKAATKRNDAEHVSAATEYVLVYAKDKDKARTGLLERTDEHDASYTNQTKIQKVIGTESRPGGQAAIRIWEWSMESKVHLQANFITPWEPMLGV